MTLTQWLNKVGPVLISQIYIIFSEEVNIYFLFLLGINNEIRGGKINIQVTENIIV